MAKTQRKERYLNRTNGLQIVYDETGVKRELVPGGSIFMSPEWAKRFKCLRRADQAVQAKVEAKGTAKKKEKEETPESEE